MPHVADTSALYAAFAETDRHHKAALDQLQTNDILFVPSEILAETIDLVGRRFGHDAARTAVQALLARPTVRQADSVHVAAIQSIHDAARGKLSWHDAIVVETCRALALPAFTFDGEIRRALA